MLADLDRPAVEPGRIHGARMDVSIILLDPVPASVPGWHGLPALPWQPLTGHAVHVDSIPGTPPVSIAVFRVNPGRVIEAAFASLATDERGRAATFHRPCDRDRYCIAHAALRSMLAERLGIGADQVEFGKGARGKPTLRQPPADIQFNLSYSDGVVAIAVSTRSVGIDVEAFRRDLDVEGIAMRFFTDDEQAYLREAPPGARLERFLDVWTRKEAAVKASGIGVVGLASACVIGEYIRLPDERGNDVRYRTRALPMKSVLPRHALAIAYRSGRYG